jgi:hypothetical protein
MRLGLFLLFAFVSLTLSLEARQARADAQEQLVALQGDWLFDDHVTYPITLWIEPSGQGASEIRIHFCEFLQKAPAERCRDPRFHLATYDAPSDSFLVNYRSHWIGRKVNLERDVLVEFFYQPSDGKVQDSSPVEATRIK